VIQFLLPALLGVAAARRGLNASGQREPTSPGTWILFYKFVVIVTTVCLEGVLEVSGPVHLVTLAALVLFCLPTLLLSRVLVRLRMPRLTYWTMRCCMTMHYAGNQHVGAMLYATLTATRMRDPSTASAWLYERFRAKPIGSVLGQTILGHLAAAQGDRVTAQCLFESIDARPRPARSSIVRVTTRDWLVMDAARQGDWSAAARFATRDGNSRWSRAVGGMARTIDGVGRLPKWRLRLLWLVAPRRLRLRPLLQRALLASVREHVSSDIAPPRDLPAALALFAEALAKTTQRSSEVSSSEFVAAVRWVTIRLESADAKVQLGQRLAELDSTLSRNADSIVSDFKSDLVKLILPVVAANPELVAAGRSHPIIADAIHRLQGTAFESIEMRAKDLARRAEKRQSLDPLSEWQSWAMLCDEANRLLALQPNAKATLFALVWHPLLSYAAFQHNEKQRPTLAQDIFRWLRPQAGSNRQAIEVLDKNLACYQPLD
jgi:hypothetical protein